jgi:hypothetical protein
MRKGRSFTKEQLEIIFDKVQKRRETNELSMLVYLLLNTNLKMNELLGWFNRDQVKRKTYIKGREALLIDYVLVPLLFPKTHHAYLIQWKRACRDWVGENNATFEMLKRPPRENSETAVEQRK